MSGPEHMVECDSCHTQVLMSFCCEWLLPVCVCSRETLHQAYDGTILQVPFPVPVRGRW